MTITINARSIMGSRGDWPLKPLLPQPDYGNDDLRNARLIAAYHVRRGAWPEYMLRWKASLSMRDRRWIDAYENRGEWGYTGPSLYDQMAKMGANVDALRRAIGFGVGAALVELAPHTARALQAAADAEERRIREQALMGVDRAGGKDYAVASVHDFATGYTVGIQSAFDVDAILITVERLALRNKLERIFIPATVACWLAKRWPAWALPAVVVHRVQNGWRRIRG